MHFCGVFSAILLTLFVAGCTDNAALLVPNGVIVIDPRGEVYTEESIRERPSVRKFMDGLQTGGVDTGGHAVYGAKEKQALANALDRALTRAMKGRGKSKC